MERVITNGGVIETKDGPLYPIFDVIVNGKVVGSSEMLGNIENVMCREILRGADEVIIRKSDQYVDARVPGGK